VFISRRAYQDLKDEITQARADAAAQRKANEVLEANMNWFRHRMTQIEAERAVLIHRALGVTIPTPEFHKVDPVKKFMSDHALSDMDIFSGLSDEEAREQGIEWDGDGRLKN
jgi:predicted nuclease with TOPRIM domain